MHPSLFQLQVLDYSIADAAITSQYEYLVVKVWNSFKMPNHLVDSLLTLACSGQVVSCG